MLTTIMKKYDGWELEDILKKLEKGIYPCKFGDLRGLKKIELIYYLKHCLDQKEFNEIQGASREYIYKLLNADEETRNVLDDFFNTRAIIDDEVRQKEFTNVAELIDDAELIMNIAISGEMPCKISDLDKFDTLDKKIEYIKYCVNRATDKLQSLTLYDLERFDIRTLNEIYNNIRLVVFELGLNADEEEELFNILNIAHLFRNVIKHEESQLMPFAPFTSFTPIKKEIDENPIPMDFEVFENPMYFETEDNPLYK